MKMGILQIEIGNGWKLKAEWKHFLLIVLRLKMSQRVWNLDLYSFWVKVRLGNIRKPSSPSFAGGLPGLPVEREICCSLRDCGNPSSPFLGKLGKLAAILHMSQSFGIFSKFLSLSSSFIIPNFRPYTYHIPIHFISFLYLSVISSYIRRIYIHHISHIPIIYLSYIYPIISIIISLSFPFFVGLSGPGFAVDWLSTGSAQKPLGKVYELY